MSLSQYGAKSEAVDVTAASWAWASTHTRRPIGIFCNAASTIVGALLGDASEVAWVIPAGYSPLAFRSINTSSTTKSGMRILYGA